MPENWLWFTYLFMLQLDPGGSIMLAQLSSDPEHLFPGVTVNKFSPKGNCMLPRIFLHKELVRTSNFERFLDINKNIHSESIPS